MALDAFFDDTSSHRLALPPHEVKAGPWGRVLMELPPHDRFQHRTILGKTGMGKSTLLRALMLRDIEAGDGLFYIDPHGQDADALIEHIPRKRRGHVILFDPSDAEHPAPVNVLEGVAPPWRAFTASSLVDTFKSIWGYDNASTPVMDQYLYNSIAALLEMPRATLMDIYFLLTCEPFRKTVLTHVTDPVNRDFWETQFTAMGERERRESARSTLNKIGMLIADPRIRAVIGYPKSVFKFDEVLNGKILIARLLQGRLGLQKTQMLGSLLLARIHAAALARDNPKPFHIYLDECHHFGTGTLIEMLSGIRKFGVSLTLSHQYLDQLSPRLRDAILGTVGTKIVFRVGLADAEALRHEFPVDNLKPSIAETPPHVAQVSTSNRRFVCPIEPISDAPNGAETAKKIRAYSRRHYTIAKRRVEHCVAMEFVEKSKS